MTATVPGEVLILGAGVHGAGIARELVDQGVPVRLVDAFDIASGATSKSSRLIHGGLRYLEYGDFRLVRESLEARSWNLAQAPQFVQPLRLYIPTARRWSGLARAAAGFLGLARTRWTARRSPRGFWPVRMGLWLYDRLRNPGELPRSSSLPMGAPGAPRVNPRRYRWLCAYSDAQMLYPERFVVALLTETRQIASRRGVPFRLSTYSRAEPDDGPWRLRDALTGSEIASLEPACVVNVTGAWGDATLNRLRIDAPPLFGGTKGSHFITWNDDLRSALQGQAVYAEANDGRLVFVLPFGDAVLVGTTDETFVAQPETAVASEEELEYLVRLVNDVMDCRLTRADVAVHYSGVRPLPRSPAGDNAAVSRDYSVATHHAGGCPVFTLVGGKLTTWRECSRHVSDRVLEQLRLPRRRDAVPGPIPGGEGFPRTDAERQALWDCWTAEWSPPRGLIAALWPLYGTRTAHILAACHHRWGEPIRGSGFTTAVVRWVIENEWVRTLSDLIERRLMLVFARTLRRATLSDAARCLVECGGLSDAAVGEAVEEETRRLATHYGRRLDD
jgi:glycerol-3-phosphate dehydrogenase